MATDIKALGDQIVGLTLLEAKALVLLLLKKRLNST